MTATCRRRSTGLAILLYASCSLPGCETPAPGVGRDWSPLPDADPAGTVSCSENGVPLAIAHYDDSTRYFVTVELDGRDVALQLDTGSSITFLFQGSTYPPYTPDFAQLGIGCESVSVAGRNISTPARTAPGGQEVVGLLGMDYLLARPSLFDPEGGMLIRYERLPDDLAEDAAYSVAYDDVLGHALVPCTLDGASVRLMFDTGGDTLWVGQQGRPGDSMVYVQDAQGTVFPVFLGTAELSLPFRSPRLVPMMRAPEFPYFEQTVQSLGGNLHGLIGVTAFPASRLLFSGRDRLIYVIQ